MKKMLWILCAGILCLTCSAVPAPSLIVKEKPKAKYENPCARVMNNTLRGILNNPNHRCFGNQTYREWMQFFDWAVWGWLSGDSEFRKDERLPGLVAEWMDHHLKVWRPPPSDPAAAPETVLRRAVQRADIAPVVEIFPVGAVQGEKHPVQLVALEQAGEMIVCGLVVHMGNNSSFYQYSTRQGGKSSLMWG